MHIHLSYRLIEWRPAGGGRAVQYIKRVMLRNALLNTTRNRPLLVSAATTINFTLRRRMRCGAAMAALDAGSKARGIRSSTSDCVVPFSNHSNGEHVEAPPPLPYTPGAEVFGLCPILELGSPADVCAKFQFPRNAGRQPCHKIIPSLR